MLCIDPHAEYSQICILDEHGEVTANGPGSGEAAAEKYCQDCIV